MTSMGHLLKNIITLRHYSGFGGDGKFTYGDPVEYNAYVEHKPLMVMTSNMAQSPASAFLLIEATVDERDELTLENGTVATIKAVNLVKGFGNTVLWSEVYA